MDNKELQDQLKEMMDNFKVPPELKNITKLANDFLNNQPILTKSIKINGVSCIAHQYKDKVSIILPTIEMISDYYNSLSDIEVKPKKSWFKW